MKFKKEQKVVCIADKNDWDSILSDFNQNLLIALNKNLTPEKGKTYTVNEPMSLHYNGKCYIKLVGFDRVMCESGFEALEPLEKEEENFMVLNCKL